MNKNKKTIVSIVVALVVIIGVFAFLNQDSVSEKKSLNNDAIFIVMDNGEEVQRFNMEEIRNLGETNFKANLKTNGKDPVEYEYTGVLLKTLFEEAGVSIEEKDAVVMTAADGYATSVEMKKVMEDDNVYVAYMREGESIGTKEDGGKGPYQIIISKDQFSQYWCKYALSADAK
ncbi:molybdopterin-dependent oxidoreductase [Clostridium sp. DL1XJH146]